MTGRCPYSPLTTRYSLLLIHHAAAQGADAGDFDLEHIAGLHPYRRIAAVADALGRAGRNHVARRERGEVGAERNDVRNGVDEQASARMLHLLAVEPRHQVELGWIGQLVG